MRIRYMSLAAAAAVVLAACGDSTEPRVPTSVAVDQQQVTLEEGESVVVVATVFDQDGRAYETPPEGFAITWSSSAPAIASVDLGEITGESMGSAVVTAQAGTLPPAEVQVTVESRTVTTQMGFAYSGHRSGSFSIEETFALAEIDWLGSWALTLRNLEFGDQDLMGQRRRGDGLLDFIWFWMEGHVTGTGTREAYGGFLLLGYDPNDETVEASYEVITGPVTFTSVTNAQLAGTFTLSLEEDETGAELDITGGTFDVPLVTEEFVFGDPAAFDGAGSVMLPGTIVQHRRNQR